MRFLTSESEKLLQEVKEENEQRKLIELDFHSAHRELDELKMYLSQITNLNEDKLQINSLNDINQILDRDKCLQAEQIQNLYKQKDELISNIDEKLMEIKFIKDQKY